MVNKIILFILLICIGFMLYLYPPFSEKALISLKQGETSNIYTIEAGTKDSSIINSATIYRNNSPYFRAYPYIGEEFMNGGMITFVFDDGWKDVFDNGYKIFKKHNAKATVSVIRNYVDRPGAMSSKQIKELIENDWDVASHSVDDISLVDKSATDYKNALLESKDYLWDKFFATVNFIYPYGESNIDIEGITRENYLSSRGYQKGVNTWPIDPYNLKIISIEGAIDLDVYKSLVDEAAIGNYWIIFTGHHISNSKEEFNITPSDLDSLLAHINNKKVKIVDLNEAIQKLDSDASFVDENKVSWSIDKKFLPRPNIFWMKVNESVTPKIILF